MYGIKSTVYLLLHFTLIMMFLLISGCSRPEDLGDPEIARIGNQVITASEFRSNYEFGMPFLKKGAHPKETYLEFMVREKILAQEGYRLGLDRCDQVKTNEKALLSELLLEELFDREIKSKIVISEEEVREATIKAQVSWKFRYWFEPNLSDAQAIQQAMKEMGYARVVSELLQSNPEVALKPQNFESGYMTWMEIDPAILEAIKDLPAGDISEPVFINGVYVIFQITDIQRKAFTEILLREEAERMRQVLFYRKALDGVRRYVDDLMTPKKVVTKGDAFVLLADAVAEWKAYNHAGGNEFKQAVQGANRETRKLYELKKNLDKTLTVFAGGRWSIADMLERLDPTALKSNPEQIHAFRNELNQRIAITLRNHFIAEQAQKLGLQRRPRVQRTLQLWRDKWVYDQSRQYFLRDLSVDSVQVLDYFLKNRTKYQQIKGKEATFSDFRKEARRDLYLEMARGELMKRTLVLQQKYPVKIYHEVLDTISVSASTSSRWMSVQLFKSGTGHMAVPIVDPAWGL